MVITNSHMIKWRNWKQGDVLYIVRLKFGSL